MIANYTYDLVKAYNSFYQTVPILGVTNDEIGEEIPGAAFRGNWLCDPVGLLASGDRSSIPNVSLYSRRVQQEVSFVKCREFGTLVSSIHDTNAQRLSKCVFLCFCYDEKKSNYPPLLTFVILHGSVTADHD